MDLFLGYFGAVSICCGCYFVVRLITISFLLLLFPLCKSCLPPCKKVYLRWFPPIISVTLSIAFIILGVQFYELASGDTKFYDVRAFVCYFLIVTFSFVEEIIFQLALSQLPFVKIQRSQFSGSIQYENMYQSTNN